MIPHDWAREVLDAVIQNEDVEIVFQPIHHVTGGLWGFDVLTRFRLEASVPLLWRWAEKLHRAPELDRLVVQRALETGYRLPGLFFIRISPESLKCPVSQIPRDWAHRIVWVASDSAVRHQRARSGIRLVQSWGYHVAWLHQETAEGLASKWEEIHPSFLMLDRGMVQRWVVSPRKPLPEWVTRAQKAGAQVIALGVEELSWVSALKDVGVDAAAGRALGSPYSAKVWSWAYEEGFLGQLLSDRRDNR